MPLKTLGPIGPRAVGERVKQVPCINDILKDNFIESNKKPDHRMLLSLLTEAAQMTQNKKKNQTLRILGGIKVISTSPTRQR
jgi:hypothetical protein